MNIRRYSELITLKTFEDRFNYLKLDGKVSDVTFGFERIFNQMFYKSKEWGNIRDSIIIRDNACDLGIDDNDIHGRIIIHHMNPITIYDLDNKTEYLLDPEYLICTSHMTHNAIHYGNKNLIPNASIVRKPNDTCPWKV